ncbi:MAG: winged helix-turn-helix domain-containing protein [Steroidobacteraceae bacterium]
MSTFVFENHSLDVDRRELRKGSELVPLEPQVFDLLTCLIANRDRVLSKDDLISAVWGGRIVSDSTLTSRINAARRAVGDSGEEQRLIRTYARKGVRFVGEVRESANGPGQAARTPGRVPALPETRGKPRIAVLPFVNVGGDVQQEYFADGITEDVIAALTRHRSVLVIARNSTFALRGQSGDVRRIGSDLGADYLVEGSVRRVAGRVRVTVQLVETESGQQLWAEQYDRALEEIFDVQDEITATITARIEPEVGQAERARAARKPPQTFGAWDYFRMGTKHFYASTAEGNAEAQRLFRHALELDPGMAEAYGFLSYAIVLGMIYFDADPDDALLDEAVEIAKKGVMLDDRDASIRFMYGRALLARKSYGKALDELEAAMNLDPNLAVVYCGLGDSLAYEGRLDEAIPYFQKAVGLSPHDPLRWAFYSYGALAYLFAREYELAEDWSHKATLVPNCHYWGYAHRVAALGYLRRPGDLDVALADLHKVKPEFTSGFARRRLFYVKDPQQVEIYVEGLRRAGVPEH